MFQKCAPKAYCFTVHTRIQKWSVRAEITTDWRVILKIRGVTKIIHSSLTISPWIYFLILTSFLEVALGSGHWNYAHLPLGQAPLLQTDLLPAYFDRLNCRKQGSIHNCTLLAISKGAWSDSSFFPAMIRTTFVPLPSTWFLRYFELHNL